MSVIQTIFGILLFVSCIIVTVVSPFIQQDQNMSAITGVKSERNAARKNVQQVLLAKIMFAAGAAMMAISLFFFVVG